MRCRLVELSQWLEYDGWICKYPLHGSLNGLVKNMFRDTRNTLTTVTASIIEFAMTRITDECCATTSTPDESLEQIPMLFISWRKYKILAQLLLHPLPLVARDDPQVRWQF